MIDLALILKRGISKAFLRLYNIELAPEAVELMPTRKEFEGTYTFVTFPYASKVSGAPQQIATDLGQALKEEEHVVSNYNVVKGFLNISFTTTTWLEAFKQMTEEQNFGHTLPGKDKVMIEYSSPNTNKPQHLGHLRTNFIGYSVAQILEADGHEVIKTNLVNDRGIHICKSMLAYQKYGNSETPASSGIKGDHLIGIYYVAFDRKYKEQINDLTAKGVSEENAKKEAPLMLEAQEMLLRWEKGDKETYDLWKKMNDWVYAGFDETYATIGVSFDKYYYESDTYLLGKEVVEEGLEKGVFFRKADGSVWVDLTPDGLDEKLLLRPDGTSVYMTQDMGTADRKYEDFKMSRSIYVVGNEQDYHFKVLQLIMKKLGRPYADGIYHLSYGMVDLPSGKMKSREGTVVDADDLISQLTAIAERRTEELGKVDDLNAEQAQQLYKMLALGALKYFLLKVDPKKRMLFNPEESIEFQGNTGPFIQYTHARIRAISRKADEKGLKRSPENFKELSAIEPVELELLAQLYQYPEKVHEAAESLAPSVIANYLYEVAKTYNRFYAEVPIFIEPDAQKLSFRTAISEMTASVIKDAAHLLGIEVPEQM